MAENPEIVGLCGLTIEDCHYDSLDDLCVACQFAPDEDGEGEG